MQAVVEPVADTTTNDAPDPARHLYCSMPHGRADDATSLCGVKRNIKHTGYLVIDEVLKGSFCPLCVETIRDTGTICHTCKKGMK